MARGWMKLFRKTPSFLASQRFQSMALMTVENTFIGVPSDNSGVVQSLQKELR
jgi:hypothetical protein